MSGSTFGTIFKITTFGESHGKALGVVIDGCPSGIELSEDDFNYYMDRRKPGTSKFSTKRKESDTVNILSGVFEGKTTGTPIALVIYNEDQRSADYSDISENYRPGHADFTFDEKYGFRDYRGGGRSSGRETSARVAAGALALKILKRLGISVDAYVSEIAGIKINYDNFNLEEARNNPLNMPDSIAYETASQKISAVIKETDSVGGIVECVVKGVKAGIGEPVFDKLDAQLAKAMLSIGAAKGVEFGAGFNVSEMKGSENNDAFYMENYKIKKQTNNSGGTLGGISDGNEIIFRTAFKPTPSIAKPQNTVNRKGENVEISVHGRHDPTVVSRAVVVVEAMTALVILDLLLIRMTNKIEFIESIYK